MFPDGTIIEGRYRIIRSLGGGAMGKVYQAEKVTTHERFAIKFIHDYLTADPVYCARFEREVNALRGIRHPHVVDLFDWKLPDKGRGGNGYIVMEYLQGESLHQRIQQPQGVTVQEMVRTMLQVLDGLVAVHSLGIIHRDLSPSNIYLVGNDPQWRSVKILDFGLAKGEAARGSGDADGGVTQDGAVLGRAAYAAPEMFLGRELDVRADVFACGMIMYRALARRFPYRETRTDLIWVERYSQRFEEGRPYPPVRTFAANVPETIDRIIAKALSKRPADRYSSAAEMQAALVEAESAWGKSVRWQPSRRAPSEPPPAPGEVTAGETTAKVDMERVLGEGSSSSARPPALPDSGSDLSAASSEGAMHGDRSASSVGRGSVLKRLASRPYLARVVALGVLAAGSVALIVALIIRSGNAGDPQGAPPPAAPEVPDAGVVPDTAAAPASGLPEVGVVEIDVVETAAEVAAEAAGSEGAADAEADGVGEPTVPPPAGDEFEFEEPVPTPADAGGEVAADAGRERGGRDAGGDARRLVRPPRPPRPPVVLDAGTGIGIIVNYDDP